MTVGFIFNLQGDKVLLIQKKRPEWQKGKYNGIGGHLTDLEDQYSSFRECFIREVKEECGLIMKPDLIKQIGRIFCINKQIVVPIYAYRVESKKAMETIKQLTNEPILWWDTFGLNIADVVPNLMFLVPLAWYCLNQSLLKKGTITLEYD